VVLRYDQGQLALLSSAIRTTTPQEALICGTNGSIHIPAFWHATSLTLTVAGQPPETIKLPFEGNGYNYEAEEVGACLQAGKLESTVMPWQETLAIMQTLDQIRSQWGLKYPME
jgi:hypothetical protein